MSKTCTKCGKEKDATEFSKTTGHNDGLTYWCKACFSFWHRNRTDACTEKVLDKQCQRCNTVKSEREFARSTLTKDGLQKWCKVCRKNYYLENRIRIAQYWKDRLEKNPDLNIVKHLKRNYNLTKEQFNDMLRIQNNCCAVCFTDKPGGHGTWHIDHDHVTGKLRELLCNRCNFVLGMVKDDGALLIKLMLYLQKHHSLPKNMTRE